MLACDRSSSSSSAVAFPLGKITAIMGPSGAGKTTLMRMASGRAFGAGVRVDGLWVVRPPSTRPIIVDDPDRVRCAAESESGTTIWHLVARKAMRRGSAFVEQTDGALDLAATPRTLVRFYVDALHRTRVPSSDARTDMVDQALSDALLGERAANTPCALLSGGQRKRASIAVQLARDRPLIFMDEPTSGLDSAASESVLAAIVRTNERRGTTVVMVVHHPSENMLGAVDHLVLVAAGLVVYQGRPGDALSFLAASALASSEPRPLVPVGASATAGNAHGIGIRVSESDDGDVDGNDNSVYDDLPDSDDDDDDHETVYYTENVSETHSASERTQSHGRVVKRHKSTSSVSDSSIESWRRARTTVPDRIVACVAQAAGESDPDYEQRIVAMARNAPAIVVDPIAPSKVTSCETLGALCAVSREEEGPRPAAHQRWWADPLSALLCWMHLTARMARERFAPLSLMQTTLKHTLLPALIALSLSDSVRSGSQDAVTGAHAAIALSVLWTVMDSAWEVAHIMPMLDAQYIKHREDGLYGAASHLTAVNVADSLMRVPMLTCLTCIVYFGTGLDPDPGRFFVYLAAVLLAGYVSRSVCFACTCWLKGAHAVTLLSLVIASNAIIGGIYAPFSILPVYARVLAYGSFVTYATSIMVRNEFDGGATYTCSSDSCAYRTGDDAIRAFAIDGAPIWLCFVVLASLAVIVTVATWFLLVLRARAWRRV